jgi:hypothetical protein
VGVGENSSPDSLFHHRNGRSVFDVDYRKVKMEGYCYLPVARIRVDQGDCERFVLRETGVWLRIAEGFPVSHIAGVIFCEGKKADGKASMGIRDPDDRDEILGTVG